MKNIRAWLAPIMVCSVVVLLNIATYQCTRQHYEGVKVRVDTVVETKIERVEVEKPVEVERTVVRTVRDTFFVAEAAVPENRAAVESGNGVDESVVVNVPIEQVVYSEKNDTMSYTAYVSGYNVALDSLIVCVPQKIVTITRSEKKRRSGWGVGISGGAIVGYDIWHKQPCAGVGINIGITYRF